MEAFERAPACPPQLSALKTVDTDAIGGSPSSSTSCHDSHSCHNTSALQATEGPLPVRTHHFRKNAHLNTSTLAVEEAAAPEAPNQVPEAQLPEAQLPEAAPGDKRSRRKATKQWEEEDIRAPGPRAGRRKAAGSGPALRGNSSYAAALEETKVDAHSPMSDASAGTRRTSSLRAPERRWPSFDAVSQEAEEEEVEEYEQRPKGKLKRGGPCYVCWVKESTAWRTGRVEGLFPGAALCNSHGTLDRRNRLGRWCDAQGIIQLHESELTHEQKAAASKEFLKDPRAARKSPAKVHRTRAAAIEEEEEAEGEGGASARSRVRRKPALVAKRQGKADASQPWGATSPTRVKATTQATGGRKRKAPSDDNGEGAAAPALASRKRLFLQRTTESAVSDERHGTCSEYDREEVVAKMDVDLSDNDVEMGDAVASLMSMRRSGSSELCHYVN